MRKFILKTTLLIITIIGVNLIVFLFLSSGKRFLKNENQLNAFLDDSPQKSVFMVGGSSMRNSFDSELASEKLNKEFYNTSFSFAHNAGFVLNYITDKVKKGDIVVFGPNGNVLFAQDGQLGPEAIAEMLTIIDTEIANMQ